MTLSGSFEPGSGAMELVGERYRVEARLGAGSYGVVYAAVDQAKGDRVALKRLRRLDPGALLRFKQEFRSLAGLCHPNLAQLYELIRAADGEWLLVMELVEGSDLLQHLGPGREAVRVRDAFAQLASGLVALHSAGKVHCDIKPSNIMVTPEGRVVLLDFGLVKPKGGPAPGLDDSVIGTAAYMAPEQALGAAATPAMDWYSMGAILYQVLTGSLPYPGARLEMLLAKQRRDPVPPRELVADASEELAELSLRLLARDPGRRPLGDEVLELLSGTPRVAASSRSAEEPFVGRAAELAELARAVERCWRGESDAVVVRGASGVGKSSLLARFRGALDHRVQVFAGRCFETESVPYKAVDDLVDGIGRWLAASGPRERDALQARELVHLARLFPVFGKLLSGTTEDPPAADPQELRRAGFLALRTLLARLAAGGPVVLLLDDVHWGDRESALLLLDVFAPPPPGLLLVLSYRAEEGERSPFVQTLLRGERRIAPRVLELAPLSEEESAALVGVLRAGEPLAALASELHRQSGGNPFLLVETLRGIRAGAAGPAGASLALRLRARLEALPADARALVELAAVASRPIGEPLLAAAGGVTAARGPLAAARAAHLLRSAAAGRVECYHDRVRQALLEGLDRELLRGHHLALARALEATTDADPESLADHLEAGGDRSGAARHAGRAAERAMAALAFERAAALYARALALGRPGGEETRRLTERLAFSLELSGQSARAARAYEEAAERATDAVARPLLRRASEQYLACGHIDAGLRLLERSAPGLAIPWPRGKVRDLAGLLLRRAWLRGRGLAYRFTPDSEIPTERLDRFDALISVGVGLGNVDTIRTALFHVHAMAMALELGEPLRLIQALTGEAMFSACDGWRGQRRTDALLATMRTLVEAIRARLGEPEALQAEGLEAMVHGFVAHAAHGRSREALRDFDRAVEVLRRRECRPWAGHHWSINMAGLYALAPLFRLGELAELGRRTSALMRRVEEQGNRLFRASVCTVADWAWLVEDRPEELRATLADAMDDWRHEGLQVVWRFLTHSRVELYRGRRELAAALLEGEWPRLRRLVVLRVRTVRLDVLALRGLAALAAATALRPARRARWLRIAEACAREIAGSGEPHHVPQAGLLRAGLAAARGDRADAVAELAAAAPALRARDHLLLALAADHRRGELLGGEQGERLSGDALRQLEGQGVRRPDRFLDAVVPSLRFS